jgi:hypothetical protein
MSTEERPPAEERGRTGEPEHRQVISNRPDVSDAGADPDGAEDDDETTTKKTEAMKRESMKRTPTT